jgi:hypothetical protein
LDVGRERPGDAKILVSARDDANENESATMRAKSLAEGEGGKDG